MADDLAPQGENAAPSGEPQGEATQTTTPDFDARLDERLSEITGRIPDLMRETLAQWQQDNAIDDDDDEEQYDLEPGEDGYDEQELHRLIAEQVQQGVQEQIAPWQAQQLEERRDQAYTTLTQQLPELADPEKASPYVEQAYELAQRINPQMVGTPDFVELIGLIYKSAKADERAAQETPADGRSTPLESQAGAAPQGNEESDEERLTKLAKQQSAW